MKSNDQIRKKVAKALLSQRDAGKRKRQILLFISGLLAMFIAHSVFSNMQTPLKLILQTMCSIGMGYALLSILALRRFPYLTEWIDWAKVKECAEPNVSTEKINFPQS